MMNINQVKSKERVTDHGEVFTNQREVDAMLDLVQYECERLDSRFLEPACGDGNFLATILKRKLVLLKPYKNSKIEFIRNLYILVSSLYGVEILEDNTIICRERLSIIAYDAYKKHFKKNEAVERAIKFIFMKNIIHGDALTLMRVDGSNKPIAFTEWSMINDCIQRREFTLDALLKNESNSEYNLFTAVGEDIYIPTPIKEHSLVPLMEIGEDA
jgi:hypothetical protein